MLKSCKYCGRIHDSRHDCGLKPQRIQHRDSKADRFRYTSAWQAKREEIKQRDNYLCQICFRNLYHTKQRLNYNNLSVHHCEKLDEKYEKRLDNDNLLTVCEIHHKMCDNYTIPKDIVKRIIAEQNHPRGI